MRLILYETVDGPAGRPPAIPFPKPLYLIVYWLNQLGAPRAFLFGDQIARAAARAGLAVATWPSYSPSVIVHCNDPF